MERQLMPAKHTRFLIFSRIKQVDHGNDLIQLFMQVENEPERTGKDRKYGFRYIRHFHENLLFCKYVLLLLVRKLLL